MILRYQKRNGLKTILISEAYKSVGNCFRIQYRSFDYVILLTPESDNNGNRHQIKTDNDGIAFIDYLSFFAPTTRNEYIKRALDDAKRIINTC